MKVTQKSFVPYFFSAKMKHKNTEIWCLLILNMQKIPFANKVYTHQISAIFYIFCCWDNDCSKLSVWPMYSSLLPLVNTLYPENKPVQEAFWQHGHSVKAMFFQTFWCGITLRNAQHFRTNTPKPLTMFATAFRPISAPTGLLPRKSGFSIEASRRHGLHLQGLVKEHASYKLW